MLAHEARVSDFITHHSSKELREKSESMELSGNWDDGSELFVQLLKHLLDLRWMTETSARLRSDVVQKLELQLELTQVIRRVCPIQGYIEL